jgi:nuclear transport factor 2 (NTF2) superfamily protein
MSSPPKNIPSPVPPFTRDTAILKVRLIEDKWNSRNPEHFARGYSENSFWRNRSEFFKGRPRSSLSLRGSRPRNPITVSSRSPGPSMGTGPLFISPLKGTTTPGSGTARMTMKIGSSMNGLMRRRFASINDLPIKESERQYHWPLGRPPDGHPGLTDL